MAEQTKGRYAFDSFFRFSSSKRQQQAARMFTIMLSEDSNKATFLTGLRL
jgi:hypothetical protein